MHDFARIAAFLALVGPLGACSEGSVSKRTSVSAGRSSEVANAKSAEPVSSSAKGDPKPPASETAVTIAPPGSSGATIEYNPDGPNKIDESKLHGDEAACKKVKACCQNQTGALALACGLMIATDGGDCAKIAPQAVQQAKELGKPPAGCD